MSDGYIPDEFKTVEYLSEIDSTTPQNIRLECVKVAAHISGSDAYVGHVLDKAREIEEWVISPSEPMELTYDDDTMTKVYESLMEAGATQEEAVAAVSDMQNKGILFRERKK